MENVVSNRVLLWVLAFAFVLMTALAVTLTPVPTPIGSSAAYAHKTCQNTKHRHYPNRLWQVYKYRQVGPNQTRWYWKSHVVGAHAQTVKYHRYILC
jgi:hypothetical protein